MAPRNNSELDRIFSRLYPKFRKQKDYRKKGNELFRDEVKRLVQYRIYHVATEFVAQNHLPPQPSVKRHNSENSNFATLTPYQGADLDYKRIYNAVEGFLPDIYKEAGQNIKQPKVRNGNAAINPKNGECRPDFIPSLFVTFPSQPEGALSNAERKQELLRIRKMKDTFRSSHPFRIGKDSFREAVYLAIDILGKEETLNIIIAAAQKRYELKEGGWIDPIRRKDTNKSKRSDRACKSKPR